MPYDDPNLGSQDPSQTGATSGQAAYLDRLQRIQADPDIHAAFVSQGPQAATALMKAKYGASDWSINPDGTVKIPPGSNAFAWKTLLAVAAIPLIAYGAAALAGAGGAAGPGLAGGAMTSPGVAIAPSVDIGADALAGGLTAGIPTTGTLASLSTGAGAPVADVGAGAPVAAGGGTAAAPAASAYGPYAAGYQAPASTVPTSLAAPASTGGGFSGFVKTLGGYPTLIGAGVGLGAAAIEANAANNAANTNAGLTRDALNVATQEYNTNTGLNVAQANQNSGAYNTALTNTAPYRAAGLSSLNFLSQGLPGYTPQTLPPVTPVQPLSVPPPIMAPGGAPGQSIPNQAYIPTTQKTNGLPQLSTGNNWSSPVKPAQVGEKRMINGQVATWDGRGWSAQGAA